MLSLTKRGVWSVLIGGSILLPMLWSLKTDRPAVDATSLLDQYMGASYSTADEGGQDLMVCLIVSSRARNRFTGRLVADDGAFDAPMTGTVSRAGVVAASARLSDVDTNLTLKLNGQLSAGGYAIVGTYSLSGSDEGDRISDKGTFWSKEHDPTP